MRINLNLSSRSFTNRRLFWLGVVLVVSVSAWLVFWVSVEKAEVHAQAIGVSSRIRELDQRFKEAVEQENQRREAELRAVLSPHDTEQLAAARQLISRRAFSWNRLLADLERFVPKEARVSSITVSQVSAGSEGAVVSLEIKALGKAPAQLTQMMESLERSEGLFVVAQASQDQTTDEGEVPFSINVTYRPARGEDQ